MSRKTRIWLLLGACITVLSVSIFILLSLLFDGFRPQCGTQPATVRSLAWHPNGTLIAATGMYSVSLYSDTLQDKTPKEGFELDSSGFAIGWSTDGNFLATDAINSGIQIWHTDTLSLFGRITAPTSQEDLLFFSWSPDGSKLAAYSATRVSIWDTTTLKLIRYLDDDTNEDRTNFVNNASWSPDSNRLTTSDRAGFIYVWDVETGQKIITFASLGGAGIPLVKWSPLEQQVIATGDMDGLVRIWDAQSGVMVRTLDSDSSTFRISSLTWSNDGKRIAATDDNLQVWDVATGHLEFRLEGHKGFVDAADWSPDNSRLVSAGNDGTIRIWDMSNGKQLYLQKVTGAPIPVCAY